MPLMPKKTKFRKQQKGRVRGKAWITSSRDWINYI